MAAMIQPDDIDFAAYERKTEARVKVKAASLYADELWAEFDRSTVKVRHPSMRSTKLRGLLDFRPGEVTTWAGFNGHRKSMFTGQVALDLAMQMQRVLVASFEMQPARTLSRMARQAFGRSDLHREDVQDFNAWSDGRVWIFDHLGRASPEMVLGVCRYFAEELDGHHVFIDSLMMVCASEDRMDEQKQFITDLVRLAKETGLHIHLIAHVRKPQGGHDGEAKPPTKYDLRGSAAISDQVDNVGMIWANRAKKAKLERNSADSEALEMPDAVVVIDKQRNAEFEGSVKLWFHPDSFRFTNERTTPVEPYRLRPLDQQELGA